jgi:tetratricopeptide (TPR) repeat protein
LENGIDFRGPRAKPSVSSDATLEDLKREAARIAEDLLEAFPESTEALALSARVEFHLGNRTEALRILKHSAEANPNEAATHYSIGYILVNSGKPEEAVESLCRAMALGPEDPRFPPLLAESLMRTGRVDDAIAVLERHVRSATASVAAVAALGQGYLLRREYQKAKGTFELILRTEPDNPNALYGLARACSGLRQREAAQAHMQQFTEAESKRHRKKLEDLRDREDAAQTRQFFTRTLIEAGQEYRKHERLEKAEEMFCEAAAFAPKNVEPRAELMSLYEQAGQDGNTLLVCEDLCEIYPENADYWYDVGVLRARLRNLDAALAAIRRAVELDPGNSKYRQAQQMLQEGM